MEINQGAVRTAAVSLKQTLGKDLCNQNRPEHQDLEIHGLPDCWDLDEKWLPKTENQKVQRSALDKVSRELPKGWKLFSLRLLA